jgi:hypothetical protein
MEHKSKEFGKLLANLLYENGINYCPFILNSEQANEKTFRDKIRVYDYESIIAWSLVEK